jgi:hypothetical protein
MKWVWIVYALLFFSLDGYAQNKKPSFLITNDFTYQNNQLATSQNQYYNSSTFFLKWGNWASGATVRVYNYFKQASDWTLPEAQFDFYRKYAQYTTGSLEIQGGDFHSMLGRGLVLSVLQNEKAFRDRTVLGGDFHYHAHGWEFRSLGGRVEDELKQQSWDVAGGEAIRDYWKGNRFGVHASYIHDSKTYQQLGDRATWSLSWNADKLPWGLSYYAEISRLNFENEFITDGSGSYANLGWTHKNVSLLFEFKKYKNFNNELNNPPSADRGDESMDLNDSSTFRLYSQYSFFSPDIVPFVSVGRVREGIASGPQVFGGVNSTNLADKLDFSFSYGYKQTYYPVKITEGRVMYRISDAVAAEVSFRDKRYTQRSFKFNEIDFSAQTSWTPYGAVFFQEQYSEQLVDGRHRFHSGGFRINIKRDSYFEFMTGSMRGGEVCSSGQCVFLPPFRGWRVGVFAMLR